MGDYDRKPMEPPSQWLRLKGKGVEVRIRIASRPLRELKVWPMEAGSKPLEAALTHDFTPGQWMSIMSNPDWNVTEIYHFLVIDRADATAKIFTTTGGVYGKIRDYATNPEWGNPMGYDLTVKRTESPGKNYYEVTPSPNKSDLMKSDLEKLKSIDVPKLLPNAAPASEKQPDDFDAGISPEPLPWDQPQRPAAVPAQADPPKTNDAAFNQILEDEPVNLDGIPF